MYIVDDDANVRRSIQDLLESVALQSEAFATPQEFLESRRADRPAEDTLSPLEVRVLRLIAQGNSNKGIAAVLSVTEDSVKGHVRNILTHRCARQSRT